MRMGVLDIGSNTGHLAVYKIKPEKRPKQKDKVREHLALGDHVHADGTITREGRDRLLDFIRHADKKALHEGWTVLDAVATATIRDAPNQAEVLAAVNAAARSFTLRVLDNHDEARLTYLAARRWLGDRSSGRIAVIDIGGGSLEIAAGEGEVPEQSESFALGARRLTRDILREGRSLDDLRTHVRAEVEPFVAPLRGEGLEMAVGTSWTMRKLGKRLGEKHGEGRTLRKKDVSRLIEKIADASDEKIKEKLDVSKKRAGQVLAGVTVVETVMDLFDLDELEICPWALREGVLLQHLDHL